MASESNKLITASKKPLTPDSKTVYQWTVLTDEKVANLESVFKLGVTIETACRFAEIDETTYYRAYKRDPSFARKMDKAREFPRLAAGQVVIDAITQQKDVATSRWWLEKKHGKEFSGPVVELNQTNQTINLVTNHEQFAERLAHLFSKTATQRAVEEGEAIE